MNIGSRLIFRLLVALVVSLIASVQLAQQAAPGTYVVSMPAASFTVESTSQTYDVDFPTLARFATGAESSTTVLVSGLSLPSGSVLDQVTFEVFDNDPANDIEGQYLICTSAPGGVCGPPGILQTTGQAGWQWLATGELGWVIDNVNNFYELRVLVRVGATSALSMFRRAAVYYHPQVSPAPAIATFNDVPTGNPYFQFVEAISAAGVTAGCGGGNYCPDAPITRGQMAVFLSKALGLYWPLMPPSPAP